jgi:hypothetical protein
VNELEFRLKLYELETERLKALGEIMAIDGIGSSLDAALGRLIVDLASRSELRCPETAVAVAEAGPSDGMYPTVSVPPRPFPGVKA